ncbi:MAG: RNA methyltransferase [Dactylosporangium sp.]|nr:RNA methyltransferase [Dactylosporangium sp.]NNJ60544.1 RNA methyltransferase [Dactylosporangium sp.]
MTSQPRPGAEPVYTPRTPRVVAARKLHARRAREEHRRFLVEGPQAVREAVASGVAVEVFGTVEAEERHRALLDAAVAQGARRSQVTAEALACLAETVHPQGLVAVCRHRDVPLAEALAGGPELVAVLVDIRDPGNAGTVLRTADAAGAGAVVFAGQTVDPYNGKCVRASAGSLFHLDLVRGAEPVAALAALRAAGLRTLAAHLRGAADLDRVEAAGGLAARTAWLFGSEAHGLPEPLAAAADAVVRVPIHGRAESLNLAAAAAVCLYASARAHHAPVEAE